MKKMRLKIWLLAVVMLLGAGGENAIFSQILTFEFSGLNGDEVSAASNTNDANLNTSSISRGSGLTASVNTGRYNATNWALTSIANAVSGNKYMEFTISPKSGYQFSVSSIVVQWQRSNTGNTAISLRSSVDNYATDLDGVKNVTDNTSTQSFTWTFSQSNSSVAVTYRLYSYAEATGGSGGPGDGSGNDIVVNGTVSAATSAPTITISSSSLTGFNYIQGSGPSSEQTFTISGSNLTSNISLEASTNYEISKSSGTGYESPLTFAHSGGTVSETNVYVRLKAGLSAGSYNSEVLTATATGADNKTVTVSGSVTAPPDPEPTNHATNFAATANSASQITVTWIDAIAGSQPPTGYLVKAAISPASPTAPADFTSESDGTLVKNITSETQTAVFTGLSAETTYNFSIWPYTNSGSNINYKTDGSVPTASATTSAPSVATYTWIGGTNGLWTTASNWTPTRTAPESTDIIVFNEGATITVTSVPAQTIGKLAVSNNTKVTLQAGGTNTLTIAGGSGIDLTLESGTELNVSGSNALQISLSSGATGSISGSMTLAGGAHRLLSADASGITFNSGGKFVSGTGFAGNAFGTTSLNSIVFASSSIYESIAGSNPFGASSPNSVIVFESGSLFQLRAGTPAFSGRTYANVEIDAGELASVNTTGASAVSIDDLVVTSGTLNFNMTGTPGHSIKGNISVATGAKLNFTPSSAGTVNLNGSSKQTITNNGTLNAGSNSTLVFGNDVDIIGSITVNNLTNNAALTLVSNNNSTATLVNNGTISGSGTTTIQQYLATDRNWYMSSPFSNATAPAGNTYFEYREPGDNTEFVSPATAYWKSISSGATLAAGKGYVVNPTTAPTTISLSGTLNPSPVNVILTRTAGKDKEGFNLVGNPYPSYLNVSSINSNVDLDKSFWLRARNAGNTAWVFDSYNIEGSEGVSNSSLTVSGNIPPMQAFWVRVSSGKTGATLTLNNSMRGHQDNSNNKFRAPASLNPLVRLVVSNGINSDEAVVYFNENAADGYDAYDSPKMFNNNVAVPEIYTRAGIEQLVINGMSMYFAGLQLPLGFYAGQANTFSLRASQLRNINSDLVVVLKDKQLNTEFDLTTGDAYSFTSDATNTEDRFVLMFKSASGTSSLHDAIAGSMFVSSANGKLRLQLNTEISNASVSVFNATGQSIYSQDVVSPATVLNKSLDAGVYVLKVTNGGRTTVLRTIVN